MSWRKGVGRQVLSPHNEGVVRPIFEPMEGVGNDSF